MDDAISNDFNVATATVAFALFCCCAGAVDIISVDVVWDEINKSDAVEDAVAVSFTVPLELWLKQKEM